MWKCNQSRPGFELVSPGPFPTTITIIPRAPQCYSFLAYFQDNAWQDMWMINKHSFFISNIVLIKWSNFISGRFVFVILQHLDNEFISPCILRTFVLILEGFFCCFFSLRFGQISPLVFFRWLTTTSDRNAESCNRIPSNYCLPWLSIAPHFWPSKPLAGLGRIWNRYLLTMPTWNRRDSTPGYTVTRLSIPIRGRS